MSAVMLLPLPCCGEARNVTSEDALEFAAAIHGCQGER